MKHDAPVTTQSIDDRTVAELAAEADVDTRTVIRRLAGLPVKGRPGLRVDRAIAKRSAPSPRSAA